jgi:hypothetical protein
MQNEQSIKSANFEENDHAYLTSNIVINLKLLPNPKASSIRIDLTDYGCGHDLREVRQRTGPCPVPKAI